MPFNDCTDDDPIETYTTLVKAISPIGLGYLHVLRTAIPNTFELLRPLFKGPFAAGGGFDLRRATRCWPRAAPTSSCSASCSRRTPTCRCASPTARELTPLDADDVLHAGREGLHRLRGGVARPSARDPPVPRHGRHPGAGGAGGDRGDRRLHPRGRSASPDRPRHQEPADHRRRRVGAAGCSSARLRWRARRGRWRPSFSATPRPSPS